MPCILVVDDEEDIRESVKAVLEGGIPDARVRTASSGRAGLEILREEGQAVRLIIADFRMPGMDGAWFLAEAARIAPLVPSVMVTGYDLDPSMVHGAGQLIQKPFSAQEIVGAVEHAILA